MIVKNLIWVGLQLVLVPWAAAQRASSDHEAAVVGAVRATLPIRIDGRLDDVAWRAATSVTQFTQREPEEGAPVSERTEVRIVYDEAAVYIGARLYDASGSVSSRLGRRDSSLPGSDWFTVVFDSYHDHISAFQFSVNPAGVRRDIKLGSGDEDESWDPVWEAEAVRDAEGWSAELRVPLSQLRFREDDAQTWGIQLIRKIARRNEEAWFAFTPKRERSGIARYGHLGGLQSLLPRGRLELLPYAVTRAQYRRPERAGDVSFPNPFADGSDHTASLGLDLKYRLASNLTLDATINPDFGQVEVDPAVINLSAFETRFDERRPFFIEGAEIFQFGGGFGGDTQLFYSRRIGAPPPGRTPSEVVYDDMPDHSTILAAGKLTGKLGGWSLGLLDAITARERAPYITEDSIRGRSEVAPLSNYVVGRARRELREGQTVIGGITTAAHRDLADAELASRVRSSAYAGGIDFTHEWADRSWSLEGYLSGSYIVGDTQVISAAQRSSARYYQRPDAGHLALDLNTTSLRGFSGEVELSKESGEHWRGRANFNTVSPGYETNDLGFQSRADQHSADLNVEYVQDQPGRIFREWNVSAGPSGEWNYARQRLSGSFDLDASGQLLNYWTGDLELQRDFASLDDRLTRGGPLTRAPSLNAIAFSIESDSRKTWTIDLGADYEWGGIGNSKAVDVEIGFRPAPNWSVSIAPEWSREQVSAQYVTAVPDTLARATFGRRYVFADLMENEFSLRTNVNVTFTPTLTLEVFARPFIGSGRFGNLKELVRPRSFDFNRYDRIGTVTLDEGEFEVDPDGAGPATSFGVDDEDFTVRSLRGNAVLRWEWRPGSTLFLVWQQQRELEDTAGDLRLRRELRALARARPENVFVIKVSYWFNP